jgi:hypothetical protein
MKIQQFFCFIGLIDANLQVCKNKINQSEETQSLAEMKSVYMTKHSLEENYSLQDVSRRKKHKGMHFTQCVFLL